VDRHQLLVRSEKYEQRTQDHKGGEEETGHVNERKEGCQENQEGIEEVVRTLFTLMTE
jgi:hypothetical protein